MTVRERLADPNISPGLRRFLITSTRRDEEMTEFELEMERIDNIFNRIDNKLESYKQTIRGKP